MRLATDTTQAGDLEWEQPYNQFESLDEAFEYWEGEGENPNEVALGIINSAMKQGACQSPKTKVRKAASDHGEDAPETLEAINDAIEYGKTYVIGKPRGGRLSDGSTKTEKREAVDARLSDPDFVEKLNALLAEHGE